jgi:hypothetical protein
MIRPEDSAVGSDIASERSHLFVGDDYVCILTMEECIVETRPLAIDTLLKISRGLYCDLEVDAPPGCTGA